MGVRISLVNEVSHGLLTMARDFGHAETSVNRLKSSFAAMSTSAKLAMGGAASIGLGTSILISMKPALDAAERLQTEQMKLDALNMSAGDRAAMATKAQTDAQEVLGTTIAGNTRLLGELYGATGSAAGAMGLSKSMEQYSLVMAAFHDGKQQDGLAFATVKALEHRGDAVMMNPEARKREFEAMEKVSIGSEGKVDGTQYFNASKTGGVAYQGASEEYLYKAFAAYMSANTGSTAGTGLMSFNSALIGGHMDKKAKGGLAALGLQLGATGELAGADAAMATANPDQFIQTRVVPGLVKMGLKDEAQQELWVSQHFNRGTAKFMNWDIGNQQKITKDSGIYANADDATNALRKRQGTYAGSKVVLEAAWENALATLGTSILPLATKAATALSKAISSVTRFAEQHPVLTKFAMVGAALTGVILVVGGAVAILTAGFGALSIGGVLLGSAIAVATAGLYRTYTWLASINWSAMWDGIKNGFTEFFGWLGTLWSHRPVWMGGDGGTNSPATVVPRFDSNAHGTTTGGNGNARTAQTSHSEAISYVRPRVGGSTTPTTNVYLDGKLIAANVEQRLSQTLLRQGQANSSTGFDGGAGMRTPGQN